MKETGSGRVIWLTIAMAFVYVVWFNFHKFVVTKNYDFFVEAPCNQQTESCYLRTCDDGECPPNNLESYKVWRMAAKDFSYCADDTCKSECLSGKIFCESVPCDPEMAECSS